MLKANYINAILIATIAIFSISCSNDDDSVDEVITPVEETGTLMFHFHPMVNGNAYSTDTEYTLSDGTRFKFDRVSYYVSGINIKLNMDGSQTSKVNEYLLVDPSTMMYSLGDLPVGEYHGFTFDLGVDSVANYSDPSTYEEGSALAPQSPSMHWSWNSGYKFIVIEGKYDASATNTGAIDTDFVFHIGSDALLRNVDSGHTHFSLTANEQKMIDIEYDLYKLFDGVNLKVDNSTHTMNNMPLATTVADNAMGMFSFEH